MVPLYSSGQEKVKRAILQGLKALRRLHFTSNHPDARMSAGIRMTQLAIPLKNQISEIERVHEIIKRLSQQQAWDTHLQFNLNLALEEVLANIISYGYDDTGEHDILIRFSIQAGELTMEIEDDGRAFNPLDQPAPDLAKPLEERKPGGVGIFLIRKVIDQMEYRRENGKNILTLKKKY